MPSEPSPRRRSIHQNISRYYRKPQSYKMDLHQPVLRKKHHDHNQSF